MAKLNAQRGVAVLEPAGSIPPLVPQLRVITVASEPSSAEMNQRLRSLALCLRGEGHALLAAVPVGSLLPEDATAADASGIEYVFMFPRTRASSGALAGWKLLLRRFQPNIIHISADVPPPVALRLARATSRMIGPRPAIVLELPVVRGPQPASKANGHTPLSGRLQKYATQVVCAGIRDDVVRGDLVNLGVERVTVLPQIGTRAETTAHAITLAILHDTHSAPGALAALHALSPLLLAQESLRVVVLGGREARGRHVMLDQWPEEVRSRIVVAASVDEWLRHASDAVGVLVSPVGHVPLRAIGAVLALSLPLVAPDDALALLGSTSLLGIRTFRRDHPGALPRAINELLGGTGEGCPPASVTDRDDEARRLMSVFAGIVLRERAGEKALLPP